MVNGCKWRLLSSGFCREVEVKTVDVVWKIFRSLKAKQPKNQFASILFKKELLLILCNHKIQRITWLFRCSFFLIAVCQYVHFDFSKKTSRMLQFVPKRCIWIVSAIWGKDSSRHLSPWALQESVDELSETLRTVSKVPLQVWTMHVVNVVNVVACRCFALLHVHLQRLYDLHRFTSFTYLYSRCTAIWFLDFKCNLCCMNSSNSSKIIRTLRDAVRRSGRPKRNPKRRKFLKLCKCARMPLFPGPHGCWKLFVFCENHLISSFDEFHE